MDSVAAQSQAGRLPPGKLEAGPKSALAAAALSVVPGVGQIYAGARVRGAALLTLIPLMVGIVLWKYRFDGDISLSLTVALLALIGVLYLWNIWDAARIAGGRPLPVSYALLIGAFATYSLGYVVTDVDVIKLLTEFADVQPILRQIVWPWPAAIERDVEFLDGETFIDVPCGSSIRPAAELVAGGPSITVSPTCGDARTLANEGTIITVEGRGFRPNEEVTIWWEDDFGQDFRPREDGGFVRQVADASGNVELSLHIPQFLLENPQTAEAPQTVIVRQEREVGPLRLTRNFKQALDKMIDTVFLGLIATTMGVVLAVPVSFLAARNLMSTTTFTFVIYLVVRTILNIIRSVEPIIWAVMFILWVGLGPFAGVMALTIHTIAALGKLYSESIESIDNGPIEAIQATGANRVQVIMYAIVPQIVPPFVAFTFYRWDINVRMSTIIGIVGGGGIGFLLIQWIRLTDYDAAGIAVWMIAVVVATLDYVSSQIRADFV